MPKKHIFKKFHNDWLSWCNILKFIWSSHTEKKIYSKETFNILNVALEIVVPLCAPLSCSSQNWVFFPYIKQSLPHVMGDPRRVRTYTMER